MKIAFDAKRIYHNRSGLGNYGRNLLEALDAYFSQNRYVLYNPWKGSIPFQLEHGEEHRPNLNTKLFGQIWRRSLVAKQAQKEGVDIFHGLSGELPTGLSKRGIASVVSIHDLIFLRYPEWYKALDRKIYRRKALQAARDAKLVVAISQQTRNDLIQLLGIAPEKIKVIGQSCEKVFLEDHKDRFEQVKKTYPLPDRFALFVGTLEPRKNPVLLAQACIELQVPLVVIGRPTSYWTEFYNSLNSDQKSLIQVLKVDSNKDLATIYQLSEVMAYPSVFEGFGIPLLEAMFSKTALITANNSALKEVAGPGSYLVDDITIESLKHGLNYFWDGDKREKAVKQNYNFVQQFHPKIIAKQWMQTYQDLKAHA